MWQAELLICLQEQETYIKIYVYRSTCIPVAKSTANTHILVSSTKEPGSVEKWQILRLGQEEPTVLGVCEGDTRAK